MERKLPLILFFGGLACIIAGIVTGEGRAGIFIIFPFVVGTGWLMVLGIVLIFLSIAAFLFTGLPWENAPYMQPGREQPSRKKKAGGLILIGPIPIVVSNDKTLALVLLVIGVAVAVILWLLLPFF